ncbi:Protein-S-isoprenylcysteine O-methyltransferase Ste14 [Sphingomonas guangdongensis]|uniref:Protein-S-isoprenylcysteine O-methyltransferase Ste14 n=1 Tax=Sphingomonas guangdongensis TaxID=1141890 RepID=A0A285QY18_9SPHN|nr:isoprenylcysteine carboxylmethyltransferase family protein [Sphingomonas guangdongensis]SOB86716.1 Protein-S-isoprenylcysteine O-methyltransferase Ste14 [Sphingomonas guangdongensis]
MYHDRALAEQAVLADPRPASAVSGGVGIAGLAGLLAWTGLCTWQGMDGPYAALCNLVACALPMVLWSLLVDKVHRRPSTGIDWTAPRPFRETIHVSLTKLAGLWLTWGALALTYALGRFWWEGNYLFSMWCLQHAAPIVVALSIPWVLWSDRYLQEPRDGAWALGAWVLHLDEAIDAEVIFAHLRAWAVKGFFLAFMLAIVPAGFGEFVRADRSQLLVDPVALAGWLINLMFLVDVAFATVGYMLTMRVLDSHIRSANPFAAAWMAALICYPPFILMGEGGPLDYHPGTGDWTSWFAGHPLLLAVTGAALVMLTAVYAWATVAFGLRFSNLTHRGVLTHGPYAWSRHPAYLSKNLFWWLSTLPFLATTGSWADAARNTALMGLVSGVYYWRARTEERHLLLDPTYAEYHAWMGRNAPVPRLFARLRG